MGLRTPLYELHVALGAKMVDFGGWDMPLHYGSQVEEHHQVRRDCGVFECRFQPLHRADRAGRRAFAGTHAAGGADRCRQIVPRPAHL